MEQQRIGSITPSVPAAGLDPAFVPGLTPPRSDADEAAGTVPEQAGAAEDATAEEPPAEAEAAADDAGEPAEADAEAAEDPESAGDAEDTADAEDPAPDFEVSDRRGAIIADRIGVRFRLDEEEADFRWDEIAAVEIDTPRFGRRFSVTVYTPERRWYEAQVEATSRGRLKEWTAQLDAVLDTYFEDEEEKAAKADAEAKAEEAGADADAETTPSDTAAEASDEDAEAEADTDADATSDDAKASDEEAAGSPADDEAEPAGTASKGAKKS
ncbi:hypothetical protein [Actinacidiphila yanglinensis]|uniref:hypothetical protein n=1 Tax=Actinacidiphila yanglinensis TaxID=310779 RepID=UPI000CDEBBA3|nr:hypothetical protein [Actinacidiphila yanglinensis]